MGSVGSFEIRYLKTRSNAHARNYRERRFVSINMAVITKISFISIFVILFFSLHFTNGESVNDSKLYTIISQLMICYHCYRCHFVQRHTFMS